MDIFADPVLLSRIQFALTASYHFIFVPITIGIGLIMAIFVTKAFRSKDPEDDALARMWVRIYTATFAIGVATGITMEFSFGTNWANYSRFVGDIFGAPLAAEALFAFFLESIFLGFIIFGRNKIKPAFYVASAWLTFCLVCPLDPHCEFLDADPGRCRLFPGRQRSGHHRLLRRGLQSFNATSV